MKIQSSIGILRMGLLLFLLLLSGPLLYSQEIKDPGDQWIKTFYHLKAGNLWFNSIRLDFPGMSSDRVMTDSLPVYNAWGTAMTLNTSQVPSFVTLRVVPALLAPHQEGMLYITYDAGKKGTFGPTFDSFYLITNDTIKPNKSLIVCPDIKEDFSDLTPEQVNNGPGIVFSDTAFNFGTITAGTPVEYSFIFRNTGKSDLIIRNIISSCGCTVTESEKDILKPGEQSHIDAIFDTTGRQGEESKTITVISNVPTHPETVLTITGFIK